MEVIFGAAAPMEVRSIDDPEDISSEKKDIEIACVERSETTYTR
jgi:hypothetical protein